MKRKILIIVLCLILVGIFATTYHMQLVGADSGFDSSYDSGGGSWSSGSDWGGSSWDSDYDSTGSGDWNIQDLWIMFLLFIIVVVVVLLKYLFEFIINKFLDSHIGINISNTITDITIETKILLILVGLFILTAIVGLLIGFKTIIYSLLNIFGALGLIVFVIWASNVHISFIRKKSTQKRITILTNDDIVNLSGKEFNIEKFKKQVFNIYKELQIAWMNFDYGKIKELISDEMYNMYTNQLETLKIKNQQNIMSDIELINCEITEYCKLNNKEIFKVYMSVNCHDYIINIKNNKVLRGKKHKKITLGYILTFERNIEIVNHCPQCGSDVKNLTECKYCKSKIVNNNDKLKMTKKQIVSQK